MFFLWFYVASMKGFAYHSYTYWFFTLINSWFVTVTILENSFILTYPNNFTVVDLYTCEIHFNTVRLIAVFIICLGFLMLLLPEDWDQCIIQLSTKLRKRDEPSEGHGEAGATTGLNWRGRARTSMSTFAHWLHEILPCKHTDTHAGRETHQRLFVLMSGPVSCPVFCAAPQGKDVFIDCPLISYISD